MVEVKLDVSLEKAIKTMETLLSEPLFGTQKERLLEVLLFLQGTREAVEALVSQMLPWTPTSKASSSGEKSSDPRAAGGGAVADSALRGGTLAAVPVGDGALALVEEEPCPLCDDRGWTLGFGNEQVECECLKKWRAEREARIADNRCPTCNSKLITMGVPS